MLRFLHRRPMGWLVVSIVASLIVVRAVGAIALALVRGNVGTALWVSVGFLFWYWIAVGAFRRTHERVSLPGR